MFGGYTLAPAISSTPRGVPKPYWNRIAFINEPTAHLVGQGIIEKRGAGFVTRDGWNLLAGAEEWVAPVQAQVGPDGAVWFRLVLHRPAQPDADGVGLRQRRQRLRDVDARRIARPHLPASSIGRAAGEEAVAVEDERAGPGRALSSDNMLWRLHAQRLLVERGQKDVVPQLIALTRNKSVDELGLNGAALHALWTLHGLGELSNLNSEAGKAAIDALKHPAAGVQGGRDGAAENGRGRERDRGGGPAQDGSAHAARGDPGDRRCAGVTGLGKLLYKASTDNDNYSDRWLSRAMFIAATRHKAAFLAEYKADASRADRLAADRAADRHDQA